MKHILSEMGATTSPDRPPGGARGAAALDADPLVVWGRMACAGLAWYQACAGLWFNMASVGLRSGLRPRIPDPETARAVMTPPPRLQAVVIPFVRRGGPARGSD